MSHPLPRLPRQRKAQAARRRSDELSSLNGEYITQIDINHVLGKLFDALSANRISIKRATALAYIACLTVQTQEGAKEEARRWELDIPIFRKILKLK